MTGYAMICPICGKLMAADVKDHCQCDAKDAPFHLTDGHGWSCGQFATVNELVNTGIRLLRHSSAGVGTIYSRHGLPITIKLE